MKKLALVFMGVWFAGCSHLASVPNSDGTALNDEPVVGAQKTLSHLSAPIMFEIMLGEMLVQRGQVAQAHQLLFEVAEKTRDGALMERVFEVSMATYSVERIKQTVELWRQISPQEPTPWRVGYLMALREGNLDAALELWATYREYSTLSLEDDLKNAASQAIQGTSSEIGLAFFAELVERYPETWAAGYAYGYAADQYGQPALAVSILEGVVAREDAPSEAYFALANLYVENDLFARGLVQLHAYVTEHPQAWSIQERYARLEVKGGYYAEAAARYQRIVEANPQAYTSKLSLALLQLEGGELESAERLLNELVGVKGYEDVAHYYLGLIDQGRGQNERAMAHLSQVRHMSYYVDARLLMAQILFDEVGLEAAIDSLNQLDVALDEQKVKVARAKALLSMQAGQRQAAIAYYREALTYDQHHPQLSYALAMLLYEEQDYQAFETLLLDVLAVHPDEADILNALGYLYVEQNRNLEQAAQWLERALAIAPDSYYILDSRGWLAYRQGDLSLAESLIQRAWSLQADDTVLLHLIKIKWALGKQAEAELLWQVHHQQFKHNQMLQDIIKKLKQK